MLMRDWAECFYVFLMNCCAAAVEASGGRRRGRRRRGGGGGGAAGRLLRAEADYAKYRDAVLAADGAAGRGMCCTQRGVAKLPLSVYEAS